MTREELINTIRAAGKDITNNAESIVGANTDKLISIDIWIKAGKDGEHPTYQVENEYLITP